MILFFCFPFFPVEMISSAPVRVTFLPFQGRQHAHKDFVVASLGRFYYLIFRLLSVPQRKKKSLKLKRQELPHVESPRCLEEKSELLKWPTEVHHAKEKEEEKKHFHPSEGVARMQKKKTNLECTICIRWHSISFLSFSPLFSLPLSSCLFSLTCIFSRICSLEQLIYFQTGLAEIRLRNCLFHQLSPAISFSNILVYLSSLCLPGKRLGLKRGKILTEMAPLEIEDSSNS